MAFANPRLQTNWRRILLLVVALQAIDCTNLVKAEPPPAIQPLLVQTTLGPVQGVARAGLNMFLGIPYAAPPVGSLRWAPPQPRHPWTSRLQAAAFKNSCPQVARYGLTEAGYDEDCLFLNIVAPAAGTAAPGSGASAAVKRPVIVWIYGGAFVGGSAAIYPLEYLAERGDAVVVSINYRLGVFGFMAGPAFDAADNGAYGIEDQRFALRWVKLNIAKFGGDPENITVAGESAGAASVCMHIIAPKQSAGLFQRGIIQSAGCVQHLRTVDEAAKVGSAVARLVDCPPTRDGLACLRTKPVKQLIEAGARVAGSDIMTFAPSIGTQVVPMQGLDALRTGQFLRVPIINGGNQVELRLYVAYAVQAGKKITTENYMDSLREVYGNAATAVAAEYPLAQYSSPPAALGSVLSDFTPGNGLNNCLFLQTGQLASAYVPVYEYQFSDPNPPPVTTDPGFEMGAVHSSELPYQFPHFSNTTKLDGPNLTPSQQQLSDVMMAYWTTFATTGRPVAANAPAWPRFTGADRVLRLQPHLYGLFDAGASHHCGFWRKLYPQLLGF